MKVIVFSDAHGSRILIERILSFNPDADYFISLGDSELSLDFLMDLDIIAIKGNYYRDAGLAFDNVLKIEGKKLYLTHGHKYGVHKSLLKLLKYVLSQDFDIVLYGHTHIARVDIVNDMLIMNPGSIKSPRSKTAPSYLILNITKDSIDYTFKEAETNITIEKLSS